MSETDRGTLSAIEPHPSAQIAFAWLKSQPHFELIRWQEAFSSCAISGNRLAEVCSETLRRLMEGEPVSDRYLLGLCWAMRFDNAEIKSRKKSGSAKGKAGSSNKRAEQPHEDPVCEDGSSVCGEAGGVPQQEV